MPQLLVDNVTQQPQVAAIEMEKRSSTLNDCGPVEASIVGADRPRLWNARLDVSFLTEPSWWATLARHNWYGRTLAFVDGWTAPQRRPSEVTVDVITPPTSVARAVRATVSNR